MIRKFLTALTFIMFVTLTIFSAADAAKPTAELMNIFSYELRRLTFIRGVKTIPS